MIKYDWEKIFKNTGVDFSAFDAAREMLAKHGFSFGSMQREAPVGIMLNEGDQGCYIPKWRNLSRSDIESLHGVIEGFDKRNGDVIVKMHSSIAKMAGLYER